MPKVNSNKHMLRWVAVLLWMGLIFSLSSIPGNRIPTGSPWAPFIVHLLEYFVLTLLLIRALGSGADKRTGLVVLLTASIVAFLYGVTDEFHQLYVPGRVSDMMDMLINSIGIILAATLAPVFFARRAGQETDT